MAYPGAIRRLCPLAIGVALGLSLIACSSAGDILDTPEDNGDGSSGLVASDSNPPTGDATLTEAATLVVDENGSGLDKLTLSQTVGETAHTVVVTWDTATHAIQGVSHVWGTGQDHGGPTSGFTACFAGLNDCDSARVSVDFAERTVEFTGQVLDDVFGGTATSTLTGSATW